MATQNPHYVIIIMFANAIQKTGVHKQSFPGLAKKFQCVGLNVNNDCYKHNSNKRRVLHKHCLPTEIVTRRGTIVIINKM